MPKLSNEEKEELFEKLAQELFEESYDQLDELQRVEVQDMVFLDGQR